jgi:hypothetical protein
MNRQQRRQLRDRDSAIIMSPVRSLAITHARNGRLLLALALCVSGVASVPTAQAQVGWRPRLELDNDVYNFWRRHTRRPDEEYTNGVHASLEAPAGPWWGARFAPGAPDCDEAGREDSCRSTQVTLGQDLYTPHLDRTPHAVTDWELERPYFAWLFLRGTARVSSERALHSTSLSLGVTGPPAGGALAQRIAHRIGFNEPATGWETQIGFEPGAMLEYRRSELMVRRGGQQGLALDLAPETALSLGNIRTHAELGVRGRIGWNLSHPWHPALWRGRPAYEWWFSAGGRTEFVARDMSLDGTLHRPTRRVDRIPEVRQYEFGVGIRIRGVGLEYRAITRTREYRTGPAHHAYSSMIVSLVP